MSHDDPHFIGGDACICMCPDCTTPAGDLCTCVACACGPHPAPIETP
jgi:hypothetical protein